MTASAEPAHIQEEGLDSTLNEGTSEDFQAILHLPEHLSKSCAEASHFALAGELLLCNSFLGR